MISKCAVAFPGALASAITLAVVLASPATAFGTPMAMTAPPAAQTRNCDVCVKVRDKAFEIAPIAHDHGGPKRIVLMRHADKTDDRDDEDLSEAGTQRAQRLAAYIPETFGKPDVIIATARSKHSDRPAETMRPLSEGIGVKVETPYKNDDYEDLVEDLFNNPEFKDKTIIVCWHHGKLPEMAALLGAPPGSYPDPWPDDAYNLILDLQYDPNSGAPPKVTKMTEPF
jgi:phosphohistidine phosphatase SixA